MKNSRLIKTIIYTIMALVSIIWGLIICINNIDMTNMELLITFWKQYIIILPMLYIGLYGIYNELYSK